MMKKNYLELYCFVLGEEPGETYRVNPPRLLSNFVESNEFDSTQQSMFQMFAAFRLRETYGSCKARLQVRRQFTAASMAETSGLSNLKSSRKASGDLDSSRLLKKRTLILVEVPSSSSEEEAQEEPMVEKNLVVTSEKETHEANPVEILDMCAADSQCESP